MNAQVKTVALGYILSDAEHQRLARAVDTMRFLEGLAATACSSTVTSAIDIEDLTGYLQLLIEEMRPTLKGLQFGRWEVSREKGEDQLMVNAEEEELLRLYRQLGGGDQKHLSRLAQALSVSPAKAA
jgi:hypothetical protein